MFLVRLLAFSTVLVAASSVWAGYTQRSALTLREDQQQAYWPRRGTSLSGGYSRGGVWIMAPSRTEYGGFRGGGPGGGGK